MVKHLTLKLTVTGVERLPLLPPVEPVTEICLLVQVGSVTVVVVVTVRVWDVVVVVVLVTSFSYTVVVVTSLVTNVVVVCGV